MFIIDKQKNTVSGLVKKSFSELGFKERSNLQEWITQNPSILGEDLLIIQKEYSGFEGTNERLDLLALDKSGRLVIIENKLDDSGRDVTWQSLKYASYCATLTGDEILNIYQQYLNKHSKGSSAEDKVSTFYDGREISDIEINKGEIQQRIILVSGEFRKEVTNTVLWLIKYGLNIKCFKLNLYTLNEQIFLDSEQIIPTHGTEDMIIKGAIKAREEAEQQEQLATRHEIRLKFWGKVLEDAKKKTNLLSGRTPTKDNYLTTGSGHSGTPYSLVVTKDYMRVEVYVSMNSYDESLKVFKELENQKDIIEKTFGSKLEWGDRVGEKACRIKFEKKGVNYFNETEWDNISTFLIDTLIRFDAAFREPLKVVFSR
jgi:hypothetical protein